MKKRNIALSLLLSVLLLAATCLPALAATPRVYTTRPIPPSPDAAAVMPEGMTQTINWDAVVDEAWNLLFTGTDKRNVDISGYHIPDTEANREYLNNHFWYTPRFLRTGTGIRSNGSYLTALINNASWATDPVQNRAKYDACQRAITQLLYGIKGDSSLSQWEQCLLLHDRLAAWAAYDVEKYLLYVDDTGEVSDDDDIFSAYGPLVDRLGVCNGYALAYNWLLDELGFTTYYEDSDELEHGWSKVELDGKLYFVDVTWDDPIYDIPGRVLHENFLQSYDAFSVTHDASDYDQTPSSAIYEDEEWFYINATSEIVRINGNYYFFRDWFDDDDEQRSELIERRPDGTQTKLRDLPVSIQYNKPDGTSGYVSAAPKLCAIGNTLLYITATDVRAYNPAGETCEDDEVVFTPDQDLVPDTKFFLNGIRQIDGTVYVTATNRANGSFVANTVADYTESFVYCSHPTTAALSAPVWPEYQTSSGVRLICPACRALIDCPEQGATVNHSYFAQTVSADTLKAEASCTDAAVYYYSCVGCGAAEHDDSHTFTNGEALGHDWYWTVDTEPTCANPGVKHEACTRCTATQSMNTTIPATGNHSYTAKTVKDDTLKTAATCTDAAVYYYSCANCSAVEHNDAHIFTDGDALGHDWTWVTDAEPTCANPGIKHEACSRCTATQSMNTTIPATGNHSYTAKTVKDDTMKAAATCTDPAVYYYSCVGCGAVEHNDSHTFTNGDALGHDWTWVTDAEPTCANPGVKHEACTRCTATQSMNTTIPATGNHSYTAKTVKDDTRKAAATCTEPAVYYYSCANCSAVEHNDAHIFTDGDALGHDWQWVTDTEPTCANPGVKHEACTRCTATQSENTRIQATGNHSYTAKTVSDDRLKTAATCETAATYYYSCVTCGKVEQNDAHTFTDGEALGHDWYWIVDTEPTCAEPGVKHEACTRCTATQSEDTTIQATGNHSYTAKTVGEDTRKAAATCDTAATYYYSCATCGAVEQNDAHTFTNGDALGHDWYWIVDTEPTCAEPGIKHEKCSRCPAVQSENTRIQATGNHSYTAKTVSDETRKTAATCETAATYYYSCATCGKVEQNDAHTFTDGEALGHDWRETARTEATCKAAGRITYTCSHNSAHTRTETIPQKAHTDANNDGYCDNCGSDLWTGRCAYCGQVHSGFFGWFVKFFHSILAIFQR